MAHTVYSYRPVAQLSAQDGAFLLYNRVPYPFLSRQKKASDVKAYGETCAPNLPCDLG